MKKRVFILLFICLLFVSSVKSSAEFSSYVTKISASEYQDFYQDCTGEEPLLSVEEIQAFGTLVSCLIDSQYDLIYTFEDPRGAEYKLRAVYDTVEPFEEGIRKKSEGSSYLILSEDLRKAVSLDESKFPDSAILYPNSLNPYWATEGFRYRYNPETLYLDTISFVAGDTSYVLFGNFGAYPIDGEETLLSRLLDKRTAEDAAKEIREILREEKQVSAGSAKIAPVYWWVLGGIGVAEAGLLVWILLLLRKVKRQLKTETFLRPQPQEAPPESKQTE